MYIPLQAFGIVVKLSDGILGITLLAWGNSIGGKAKHVIATLDYCITNSKLSMCIHIHSNTT